MNMIFILSCAAAVMLAGVSGIAIYKLTSGNLDFFEKLCRNRIAGTILGFPLVCWCVPHAQAIIFAWAEPYLWYIAVILSVLCYFYLDYLFARALGGLFIIGAYCFVHWFYEYQITGGAVFSIIAWLWGIGGIFISGKPSLLRDFFRRCAVKKQLKVTAYIFFTLTAASFIFSLIAGVAK